MISFDLKKVSSIVNSTATNNIPNLQVSGISTDTRKLKKGDLFFALKGPNFDGHKFISKAKEKGAIGAVVEKSNLTDKEHFPLIPVNSPLTALGDLARWYRSQFKIPIVAITGSSGKTTTKDLLKSILSKSMNVLATEGNLNNHIGLPQMIFRLDLEYESAVFELGMNSPGEIYRLTEIAHPNIGIITNIGHAHLEFLETIEKVAEAKYELWKAMDNEGTAIVNLDDERITEIAERWKGKKITFSTSQEHADVLVNMLEIGKAGKTDCEIIIRNDSAFKLSLPLIGIHNLYNAAAAVAGAVALNIPAKQIALGLKSPSLTPLRSELLHFPPDKIIFNDAYNANPDSMEAALQCLAMMRGKRTSIAILGDMLELGSRSQDFHFDIGNLVAELKTDLLFTLGDLAKMYKEGAIKYGMKKANVFQCDSLEDILEKIVPFIKQSNLIILVKGSRSMKMEKIVEGLKKKFKQ